MNGSGSVDRSGRLIAATIVIRVSGSGDIRGRVTGHDLDSVDARWEWEESLLDTSEL
jgi:hypothetical protein